MPWTRVGKYFASILIWRQDHSKLQAKFRNLTIIPKKPNLSLVTYISRSRSVNNLDKKAENLRSGRKLTTRCPDYVDKVRDSVGKSPKNSLRQRSQELSLSRAL